MVRFHLGTLKRYTNKGGMEVDSTPRKNLRLCDHYCNHGGVCMDQLDHEGLHNDGYHEWSSEESISKEVADRILKEKILENVDNVSVSTLEILNLITKLT